MYQAFIENIPSNMKFKYYDMPLKTKNISICEWETHSKHKAIIIHFFQTYERWSWWHDLKNYMCNLFFKFEKEQAGNAD